MSHVRMACQLEHAMDFFQWKEIDSRQHDFLVRLQEYLPLDFFRLDEQNQFKIIDDILDDRAFLSFLTVFPDLSANFIQRIIDENKIRQKIMTVKYQYFPSILQDACFSFLFAFESSARIYGALLSISNPDHEDANIAFIVSECKKPQKTESSILSILTSQRPLSPSPQSNEENWPMYTSKQDTFHTVLPPLAEIAQYQR